MNNKVVFFDLGDTLIYRTISLQEFDFSLLSKYISNKSSNELINILDEANKTFPEINSHRFFSEGFKSFEIEYQRQVSYYLYLCKKLNIEVNPETLADQRFSNSPYQLFVGAISLLDQLQSKNIKIGIMTNGRPSRRKVLEQLGILHYFSPELIFISNEIGFAKPNIGFYDFVNLIITINRDVVLVDDESQNCLSFQEFGGTAIKFSRSDEDMIGKILLKF